MAILMPFCAADDIRHESLENAEESELCARRLALVRDCVVSHFQNYRVLSSACAMEQARTRWHLATVEELMRGTEVCGYTYAATAVGLL